VPDSLYGICGVQSGTATGFSLRSLVFPSISLNRDSPYSCMTCGMNNRPVVGQISETQSHYINMNNYECTRQHNPEHHCHLHCHENFKFHIYFYNCCFMIADFLLI
jgi:hypothetical protein